MIKSMTGFGKARRFIPGAGRVSVEMRSVNHRFLDIVLHMPEECSYFEQKLKDAISKSVKRGHIICRLDAHIPSVKKPILNCYLIKSYYRALKHIAEQFHLKQEVDINTLATLPGIWSVYSQNNLSLSWAKVRPLVQEALDKLLTRKQLDGKATFRDLLKRVSKIRQLLRTLKLRYKKVIPKKLKSYKNLDEKNSFLRSSDINEELVRLEYHVSHFVKSLKQSKAVGKELDFILQEMQRETNTTGAKSIDAVISNKVIAMKSEIEKMREHVQNIE